MDAQFDDLLALIEADTFNVDFQPLSRAKRVVRVEQPETQPNVRLASKKNNRKSIFVLEKLMDSIDIEGDEETASLSVNAGVGESGVLKDSSNDNAVIDEAESKYAKARVSRMEALMTKLDDANRIKKQRPVSVFYMPKSAV